MNENENIILALYPDKATADVAVENLKQWDKAQSDIALGTIGELYVEDGELKTSMGHQTGKGAAIGAVLGVAVGVLTGPAGLLIGPLVAGGGLGAVIGHFFDKSMDLTEEEMIAIGKELEGGKAAVVVNLDDYEIVPAESVLKYHGGEVRTYKVPGESLEEAAKALEESDSASS